MMIGMTGVIQYFLREIGVFKLNAGLALMKSLVKKTSKMGGENFGFINGDGYGSIGKH